MKIAIFAGLVAGLLIAGSSRATAAAVPTPESFYLEVTLVTGEHGRDSSSLTRTLSVSSEQLSYKEVYVGPRSREHPPLSKQFRITPEDQTELIGLLKTKNLLVTKAISKPPTQKGFSRYFQIAILSAFEAKQNSVTIEASPSEQDLKDNSFYQGSIALIEQLYKIINRTDRDLTMPVLLN